MERCCTRCVEALRIAISTTTSLCIFPLYFHVEISTEYKIVAV